jgi:hypothetical protein
LLADALASAMRGDAHVLDQATRGALRAKPRQDAELQATDHRPALAFRHHQREVWIAFDLLKRGEIGGRQRRLQPLARAAQRVVGQHLHDGFDVVAAGAADGDGFGHRIHFAAGRPSAFSASPIQRRTAE